MRYLIDIGHPAHVHIFKNIVLDMQNRGHEFFFTVREAENETILLDKYNFSYHIIGCKRKGTVNKIIGIFIFSWRIFRIGLKFKPDIFLSHGSMYAGYASFIFRKPHIALEDSGNMEQIRLSLPVSNAILSPDILPVDLGAKQIRYRGYHELMYLTPKYYVQDSSVFSLLGIPRGTPYAIIRFVSWEASHDIGKSGLSSDEKIDLINFLSGRVKVFISAERQLSEELDPYRIDIPFDRMHDVLANALIYIGEGATMASEAGILGIPSFYVSNIKRCYIDDQIKYGSVYKYSSYIEMIDKLADLFADPDLKFKHQRISQRIIDKKLM